MRINIVETITGGIVVVLSAILLLYAYVSTQYKGQEGYKITARFNKADGLVDGSDVKIGGIRVGTVSKMTLDPLTYAAIIELAINPKIKLPTDTSASVISENLLGGKYLDLQPGGDETMMKEGDEIQQTQSSVILESLIGQFIFGNKDKDKNKDDEKSSSQK
ncbi:MAG: outer membrane lipid asymmetry maintenance protein MlaD [Alphaproteobacteria bacterium RIFCSPLOWO2_01_FULL_45_8]|nr:MAG: outer membrane lipid asymmetry maintenance protein MlaD [Alphaproteobacteria bacterium GWB1_45_5]OFW76775.1 MAG: outer membrane lipid asymmetry maintenance protein MlaD [Alphaproteobacteria bacterium GWA1_45_9]OFW89857.1 MAG: outer membrane lipid asymmetry maintenance protein MlaD [Alphaproteobacteria bacterium RIFCSPHIGHO2_01_FULL_41_14]OFW96320.1 MAG: outer membrane lipid asymmetry maintenance protein MlaD [Alphaproteobacteria bacterium RIFCSPLOWO2_01_FULL_45_8]HCI48991.1 outer membra